MLARRLDKLRFELFKPFGLIGDFTVEADRFGDEVVEFRGHGMQIWRFSIVFADSASAPSCAAKAHNPFSATGCARPTFSNVQSVLGVLECYGRF